MAVWARSVCAPDGCDGNGASAPPCVCSVIACSIAVREVEGLDGSRPGGAHSLDGGYVLTVDNLLKMLSIQLRLRARLPVVVMGETGCGKSSLVRNLCKILGAPLHTLNVHGGMGDREIVAWVEARCALARRARAGERLVLFLDEVNTCNAMALFKEVVIDRCLDGRPLPDNVALVAACNPYRLRAARAMHGGEEMAGLVFEHRAGALVGASIRKWQRTVFGNILGACRGLSLIRLSR